MATTQHIKGKCSAEMTLVILICRVYSGTADKDDLVKHIDQHQIDWDEFYTLITLHQVRPIVLNVLSVIEKSCDNRVILRLQGDNFRIAKRNMKSTFELVKLCAIFEKHEVQVIPYKGVVLSELLYNDYVSRETCDIDLLINEADFSGVRKILLEEGYESQYYYEPYFHSYIIKYSCEHVFVKFLEKDNKIQIEAHWSLLPFMADVSIDNSYLLEHTQTITLLGKKVKMLDLQRHLLALFVHHGVNDNWRSLRHIIDIGLFLEKYGDVIDWNLFQKDIERIKIQRATLVGLYIVYALLGIRSPLHISQSVTGIGDEIITSLLGHKLLPKSKLDKGNFKRQLRLRDSFPDKVSMLFKYLLAGLLPNTRDMKLIKLPKALFGLYYIIKPFRLLLKPMNSRN